MRFQNCKKLKLFHGPIGIFLVILPFLVFTFGFSFLCYARDELRSLSRCLNDINKQINNSCRKYKELSKDIKKSRDAGIRLKNGVSEIESKFLDISKKIEYIQQSITVNKENIVKAEQDLNKCYDELKEVLRKTYVLGEGTAGLYNIFFDTDCPTEAEDDLCIIYASLAQWGETIISQIKDTKKFLEESRAHLEEDKKNLNELQEKLTVKKESLEKEQDANNRLMNSLFKEQSLEKAKLDLLEIRKGKVIAQLKAIQRAHNEKSTLIRGSGKYIWPVNGPITSRFGMRWGRMHRGLDIGVNIGTQVRCAAPGVIITVGFDRYGWGNYVMIDHGSKCATLYAHLSKPLVKPGQKVNVGQVIALSGNTGRSTGPHLHFETWNNGNRYDPMRELQ